MPVTLMEILPVKAVANALAIVGAAVLSLLLVGSGLPGMSLAGSLPFQVLIAALGILLPTTTTTTTTTTTGQFGLLALPLLGGLFRGAALFRPRRLLACVD